MGGLRQLLAPLLARLGQAVAVLLAVTVLCFAGTQLLPGDPALHLAAARSGDAMGAADVARARADAGFDRSGLAQFAGWAERLARLDLGRSLVSRRPVVDEIGDRAGLTLGIGLLAAGFGLLLALPLGLASGLWPGGVCDRLVAGVSALLIAVPGFVIGLGLVALVAVRLRLLPAAGTGTPAHLVLPVATLGLAFAAPLARITRAAVVQAWASPAMVFGRLKGMSAWRAGMRHGVRQAGLPIAVASGLRVAALLEGFVVVETVFNLPGLGDLMVRALVARDIPVVQGLALLFGGVYALAGMAIDLCCLALDPRLRLRAVSRLGRA